MPEIKKFVILEFIDKQGYGAKLITNYIYTGLYHSSRNSVEITDPGNHIDWVFYNNDTCVIIPDEFVSLKSAKSFVIDSLPHEMEIQIIKSKNTYRIENPDTTLKPTDECVFLGVLKFKLTTI
jgi:hypothetical protein